MVPTVAGMTAANPYSLSTVPGYNPYLAGVASMSSSPYSLSTSPSYGGSPYGGSPFGYGSFIPDSFAYGYGLQGMASLTKATGEYWKDIQSARMGREAANQMRLDTRRKEIEFEIWREQMRATAPKMAEAERRTELDRARKDPPDTEILSGKSLNVLLKSIQSGKLNTGPTIRVEEDTLKHLNLTGGTSAGNIGMLKDGAKLNWPESLMDSSFDEARRGLNTKLIEAVELLKDRNKLPPALLKDIRGHYKTLSDKLNESADDRSPSQDIEARRFLNQVNSAIRALSDPKVINYFNNTWNAKGRNVSEMVDHMTREGLTFAPAAPGDEAAYRSIYQAMRAFEIGMHLAQN
jgi:hypothetical protein